jgi:hypothetical protein
MDRVPPDDVPDLWMVCNFETVQLWRRSTSEKFSFKLRSRAKTSDSKNQSRDGNGAVARI